MTSLSAAIFAARVVPHIPKNIPIIPQAVAKKPQELPECNTAPQSNTGERTEDLSKYGSRAQDGDENLIETLPCVPTVRKVAITVAAYYDKTILDLVSRVRTADVVRPRQVAMYLARHLTTRSFPAIGLVMGDRDHTTVMHGVWKIEQLMRTDWELAFDVAALMEALQGGRG